jgi:S-ribosylhomocysteine lyase LuxS involved in autoinducer biosynthesis
MQPAVRLYESVGFCHLQQRKFGTGENSFDVNTFMLSTAATSISGSASVDDSGLRTAVLRMLQHSAPAGSTGHCQQPQPNAPQHVVRRGHSDLLDAESTAAVMRAAIDRAVGVAASPDAPEALSAVWSSQLETGALLVVSHPRLQPGASLHFLVEAIESGAAAAAPTPPAPAPAPAGSWTPASERPVVVKLAFFERPYDRLSLTQKRTATWGGRSSGGKMSSLEMVVVADNSTAAADAADASAAGNQTGFCMVQFRSVALRKPLAAVGFDGARFLCCNLPADSDGPTSRTQGASDTLFTIHKIVSADAVRRVGRTNSLQRRGGTSIRWLCGCQPSAHLQAHINTHTLTHTNAKVVRSAVTSSPFVVVAVVAVADVVAARTGAGWPSTAHPGGGSSHWRRNHPSFVGTNDKYQHRRVLK